MCEIYETVGRIQKFLNNKICHSKKVKEFHTCVKQNSEEISRNLVALITLNIIKVDRREKEEKELQMEYVNYLITSFNGSLSHASNVLDNFEHAKCGKLKSEFHVSLLVSSFAREYPR